MTRKYKWTVYGEYGGNFTNLTDAKRCAREASKQSDTYPETFSATVVRLEDGCGYIDYKNGKCVRNGWVPENSLWKPTKAETPNNWMQVIKPDGTRLKPVIRNTVKGQSDYANRMYCKYGDGTKIEEYHFDENCNIVIDTTWG